MTPDLARVLEAIRGQRESARALGVELIGVFGSTARGEAGAESDIDVLADYLPGTTFFRIARVANSLENELGRSVDIVGRKGLRPHMAAAVERDLIPA